MSSDSASHCILTVLFPVVPIDAVPKNCEFGDKYKYHNPLPTALGSIISTFTFLSENAFPFASLLIVSQDAASAAV